jgi:hypothetical protein
MTELEKKMTKELEVWQDRAKSVAEQRDNLQARMLV